MDAPLLDANALTAQAKHSQALEEELALRNLKERIQPGPDQDKKLREACTGFETIFITKLWQEMRASLPKDGYLHSKDEEFYLSMFDQEVSKKLAESGGIGLGKMLYDQLKASMEDASRSTSPSRAQNVKPVRALTPATGAGKTLVSQSQGPASDGTPGDLLRESMALAAPAAGAVPPLDSSALYTPIDEENQAEEVPVGLDVTPFPGPEGRNLAAAPLTPPPDGKRKPGPLRPLRRPAARPDTTEDRNSAGQDREAAPIGLGTQADAAHASAPDIGTSAATASMTPPTPELAAPGTAPIPQETGAMSAPQSPEPAPRGPESTPEASAGVNFVFGLPQSSPTEPARPGAKTGGTQSSPKAGIARPVVRPGSARNRPTTEKSGLAQPDAAPAVNTALRTGPGQRAGRVVRPVLPREQQTQRLDQTNASPGTWSPAGSAPAQSGATGNADSSLQTDEPTLIAVEQLAENIVGTQEAGPSPASRQPNRARLGTAGRATPSPAASFQFSPSNNAGQNAPSGTAPVAPGETSQAGHPAQLDRLDHGIRNKQGAVHNEGGPDSPLPSESLKSFSVLQPRDTRRPPPMLWPIDGQVTSGFGWRRSPFSGERTFHAGVDIAAEHGDPVKAAWDGRVVFAGEREGYGKLVVLDHGNGWQTFYGHNSANTVKAGDHVNSGTVVAKAGSTGHSTGPHVHFEVRQNDLAWDPEKVRQQFMAGTNASDAS